MARNPIDVIDQMLEEIPPDRNVFRFQLNKLKSDSAYFAPEMENFIWARMGEIVTNHIPEGGWEKKVVNILRDVK